MCPFEEMYNTQKVSKQSKKHAVKTETEAPI